MLRRLLEKLGIKRSVASPAVGGSLPVAYKNEAKNLIYNLLFCDQPSLFAPRSGETKATWQRLLYGDQPNPKEIEAIANDSTQESRIRALAFNWLRSQGHNVPSKLLLGVVVEVPLANGMDTLAAYSDGQVRYINQSEKLAVFDGGPPEIEQKAFALVEAGKKVISRIGPWDQPRLPPPSSGHVRMTFVVSDGLYFGEGPFQLMQRDQMAGPVISKASELLELAVDVVLNRLLKYLPALSTPQDVVR